MHPQMATAGSLNVRLAHGSADVEAAQRLRYSVFYEEMSAHPTAAMRAAGRDFDDYDEVCDILLVTDQDRPDGDRVIGTYRLLDQDAAAARGGFYSAAEFDIEPLTRTFSPGCRGLEVGRSCIHRDYRHNAAIQLLWRAIAAYMAEHSIGWLFGCASLAGNDPDAIATELAFLHHNYGPPPEGPVVRAQADRYVDMNRMPPEQIDERRAFAKLPPLIKGYLRLGAYVGDGAVVDLQFHTTDVFVMLPVARIEPRYFAHFARGRH